MLTLGFTSIKASANLSASGCTVEEPASVTVPERPPALLWPVQPAEAISRLAVSRPLISRIDRPFFSFLFKVFLLLIISVTCVFLYRFQFHGHRPPCRELLSAWGEPWLNGNRTVIGIESFVAIPLLPHFTLPYS
jgi:hypothetical protein